MTPGTAIPPAAPEGAAGGPHATRLGSARRIPRLTWHQQHDRTLTPGERAADRLRNGMGSWLFVSGFVAFMLIWAAVNTLWRGWDDYPYILLNLLLSMLAGLQGAILLIAAKRQDAISAALAQHDFDTNSAAKIDIELLLDINQRQLVMIEGLRHLMGVAGSASPHVAGGASTAPPPAPISRAASAAARRGELDLGFPWPARHTTGRPTVRTLTASTTTRRRSVS